MASFPFFFLFENSKKIRTVFLVGIFFLLFVTSVHACTNPGIRNDKGVPINTLGEGILIINGSEYQDLKITYNMGVRNINDAGLIVNLKYPASLRNYIISEPTLIPANSNGTFPLDVWVGGQSVFGKVEVEFECEDQAVQGTRPFFYIWIIGKEISAPPNLTCDVLSTFNGCYQGLLRKFYCNREDQLQNTSICTQYCCSRWGGNGATCSNDRSTCLSFNNLPPGTEGNIAFLCKDDKCNDGIEKNIIFLLRLKGWNVTYNAYDEWTKEDLLKHDIIACTDQSKACKIDFNSLIYNVHVEEGKPFLEISDSKSAKAAYSFNYLTQNKANYPRETSFNITQPDPIFQGLSGTITFINSDKFVTIPDEVLSGEAIDLADVGNSQASVFFKVKENIAHSRFAFLGTFVKGGVTELNPDGEIILNNTLKWLKYGDEYFGGTNFNEPKKGKIAFICSLDKCKNKNEIPLINFLKEIGYSVEARSIKEWNGASFSNYNIIVCAKASQSCQKAVQNSNITDAHLNQKVGFIEITDTSKAYAAFAFGYTNTSQIKKSTNTSIEKVIDDILFSGFSNPIEVLTKKTGISGPELKNLLSTQDLTHVFSRTYNISSMFRVDSSGNRGKYAFIGFVPRFEYLNANGKELLKRMVNWVNCGNINC
jgi:hypothetical protein